ncbi:LD-carboxypeptidase, partial [Candidatus Roizmanbacteria bacterium CG_4_10_14_3_um_filter_39_13]
MIPSKLKRGDLIRVIAPSRSLNLIGEETRQIANKRFEEMGLTLSFGKHINETDDFASSSVESRIEDLHDAFADENVKAILTVIGGFNSNQILKYIDWNLIQKNPKIFCGFSDITVLNNAIYAKIGLATYSGPHYSTFGQKLHFDYSLEY